MKSNKTYKFKLNPTTQQKDTFCRWIDTCRYLYNVALEQRITLYAMRGKSISFFDQCKELAEIKAEFKFVEEVYSQTLQATLKRLNQAYSNFFNGSGFPKYAKKDFYNSIEFTQGAKIFEDVIQLPKIGTVKYFNSRPIEGKIKTATITKQGNDFFISICCETEIPEPTIDDSQAIGIDVGIAHFATLSNGEVIDSPMFLESNLRKLRLLQRHLSRQNIGSNSRRKTKERIAKLHIQIANQRKDFLHKESTKIANRFTSCYIEDLKLQNMDKLNSTLARRMKDNGFGMFKTFLQYKFKERGNCVVLVHPAYTSQMCSECNTVDKKSRLSQSEFVCTNCGHIDNADLNAAKNIRSKGIASIAKRKAVA